MAAGGVVRAGRKGEALAEAAVPAEYALDPSAGEGMVPASASFFEDVAAVVDGRRPASEALFARIADAVRTQEVIDTVRRDGERLIGR